MQQQTSLEHLIGALLIIGFRGRHITAGSLLERALVSGNLGGVILFDRCLLDPGKPGNIESPGQLSQLTAQLQHLAKEPLLICVDQEGGRVQRLRERNGFSGFPSARAMAAADSDGVFTGAQAEKTAAMLAGAGINVNFAPVVDLDSNPDNPIIGKIERSFSADPDIVVRHAESWVRGHRQHGIISCLKHFPGHGSSAEDSHLGFVDISGSWDQRELLPYRTLIAHGCADAVMMGHLFHRDIDPLYPASLSARAVDLLRRELGFTGVILTDDMQMKAITSRFGFSEALCQSFAAGIDMLIIGNNLQYNPHLFTDAVQAVSKGVRQGVVSEEQLIAAYDRVSRMKTSRMKRRP